MPINRAELDLVIARIQSQLVHFHLLRRQPWLAAYYQPLWFTTAAALDACLFVAQGDLSPVEYTGEALVPLVVRNHVELV